MNINENYFDPNMRHPVNNEQVERRNHYYKNLIQRVKNLELGWNLLRLQNMRKMRKCF